LKYLWLVSVLLVLVSCTGPAHEPWPPPEGEPTFPIWVSLDTWHAMIALPVESERNGQALYEEWGYAERAWYLEGRQGVTGVIRALFWPTQGVVEVGLHDRIWAARTPQPPAQVFAFRLSEEGHRRLRGHLASTIASNEPIAEIGRSRFYPAKKSYHLFHQCHQYAAAALHDAGLPIFAGAAFTPASFAMQLKYAEQLDSQAKLVQRAEIWGRAALSPFSGRNSLAQILEIP
jgi:hypothetical protein